MKVSLEIEKKKNIIFAVIYLILFFLKPEFTG